MRYTRSSSATGLNIPWYIKFIVGLRHLIMGQPSFLQNVFGLIAGYGLLTVNGNEHKPMRKMMNPAFAIPNLMGRMTTSIILCKP